MVTMQDLILALANKKRERKKKINDSGPTQFNHLRERDGERESGRKME